MSKRIVSAIDIGSTKIVAVIATIEEGKAPQVLGVAVQPSSGLKKGVLVNIDSAISSIATTLEAAERMAGMTVNTVFININGKHITSTNNKGVVATSNQEEIIVDDVYRSIESARTISIPPSREIIHVIPREFIIDTQDGIKDPIGMSGSRLEVDTHIISGVSTSIQNLTKCVQSLGLGIDDIVFSGWASAISTLTDTEKQLGVLLLDIGGGTTSLCSFIDESITYSGCIEYGGINVTSDMAICLRTTLESAEKIKINLPILFNAQNNLRNANKSQMPNRLAASFDERSMVKKSNNSDPDLLDVSMLSIPELQKVSKKMIETIIEARMSEIFKIAREQIEQAGFNTNLPAGIVLTGGSSQLPGIAKIAQQVFGVPARIALPVGLGGMIEEITNPQFAAVQGLLLHAANNNKFESKEVRTGATLRGNGSKEDNSGLGMLGKMKNFLGRFGT
jgi:cell division protein FtsA